MICDRCRKNQAAPHTSLCNRCQLDASQRSNGIWIALFVVACATLTLGWLFVKLIEGMLG